ncbi:S1 RNA binding domain 1 [Parelaphostrongylus tenuis]|uniref:S1 RNA binding domain 1 n=1 Tax=Parelaphostrongylus tenuis TaxID=148309 RepID=A0AAD5WHH8_PARTN|nr:S1 RNA binding domain 1 [Parelaphostrongylus tenuis]
MGRIRSREDIKQVKGLGAKSYEQCAGFLTINIDNEDSANGPVAKKSKLTTEPLDRTIVHPSQYDIARKLLSRIGRNPSDLPCHDLCEKLHELDDLSPEEIVVRDHLCCETKTLPPPPLMTDVRKIKSFTVGELVIGRVANQVEFGLFVDIGAEKSALAHRSVLRQPYPEVGSSLMFMITNIDVHKGRIGIRPVD